MASSSTREDYKSPLQQNERAKDARQTAVGNRKRGNNNGVRKEREENAEGKNADNELCTAVHLKGKTRRARAAL